MQEEKLLTTSVCTDENARNRYLAKGAKNLSRHGTAVDISVI